MSGQDSSDSESEYEEQEVTVLVELKGVIDSDFLNQTPFDKFKIIGLDTDKPIMQLNNYHFSGEYGEALGTMLCFEEEQNKYEEKDAIFEQSPTRRLKYAHKTFKVLNMKRVFITEKKSDTSNTENSEVSDPLENS